jgi:hypothetical protein
MRYPSWQMVLLLFRALAISVITYGMPVWQPTKAQSDRLQTTVSRGLCKVLQVPHNPDCLSLFVEHDFLTPVLEHSCAALRYAHRHLSNKSGNPTSAKLEREISKMSGMKESALCSLPCSTIFWNFLSLMLTLCAIASR